MAQNNPLFSLPNEIPFNRIEASHVVPGIETLLQEAQERIDQIGRDSKPRTFENTLGALDNATVLLEEAMTVVSHLESVATTPELREAYNAIEPKVSAFYASISLNSELWAALSTYAQTAEAHALQGSQKRYLQETINEFRRNGAELPAEKKKELEELSVELTQLTTRFSQNVLDSTNEFELIVEDAAKLSGLPQSAIEAARQSAVEKNKTGWRFTLQAPSYTAVMTYLDDAAIRQQLYLAYNRRATQGSYDNRLLVQKIVELRKRKAHLLGYSHMADLVLEDRMAKNGRTAQEFVRNLHEKTVAFFEKENLALEQFRKELEGPSAAKLQPWDVGYYSEKQRRALYDFDEEELRPYFVAEKVLEGVFTIAQALYGVRFETIDIPVWHPTVRAYAMYDANGKKIAIFYADWYPRESKRGGAWMNAIRTAVGGGKSVHVGLICGNLNPPSGDKPSLLNHREVETIFHEFGHLMHHCLSNVELRGAAGTRVAWDFVELPSQIMENWCWELGALNLFAKHYKSNEPIAPDLFERMNRARTYRAANAMMRQLGFAAIDLGLHIDYDSARDGDVIVYARNILQAYTPSPLPEDYAMIASFTHLFGDAVGYAAGYYSYKWAEVLEADAFSRFKQEGVLSSKVGGAFREHILSKGNSDDPQTLYRTFMGREPSLDALLIRSGLMPSTATPT